MKKPETRKHKSLENEVLVSVGALYLLIAAVMALVHFLQPAGQETVTSSTSLSHADQRPNPAEAPPKNVRQP